MADKGTLVVLPRALNAALASHGIGRLRLPRRSVVAVNYEDIYRLAAKVVARRYGLRKIYRFRGHQPVFSHRNLNRLTGGLLTEFFCVSRRLVGKTAEEVAASEALEQLSPERAEEVRRRLTAFAAEVEELTRSLWGALSKAAGNQEGAPSRSTNTTERAPWGSTDTTERVPESSVEKLLRVAREVFADKEIPGEVKARLHETVECLRWFLNIRGA